MTSITNSEIMETFKKSGQGHIFKYIEELSDEEKSSFFNDLNGVDLNWVDERFTQYREEKETEKELPELTPAPIITLRSSEEENKKYEEAKKTGEDALRAGRLCAFLVAGGQGTRLGFDGPKGCYPLGSITGRTLFQYHAEQIRALEIKYNTTIPWYIMTSKANDADTRKYFEENNYLGLKKENVMFFAQKMVPAVDFEGKLILEGKNKIAMSPNGHGGSLAALMDSGAIDDMKKRGVDTISYFQVDNPLVTICDPAFAGYHLLEGAGMSSKVLDKNAPEEKVGAICFADGKLSVVEYSDLDEKNMYAKDENGRLVFWAGSIAIHMLSVDFVEQVSKKGLPWHIAIKKIPYCTDDGKTVKPDNTNGVKFETFVFDALPMSEKSVTMEVVREDEFAPVKNASGIDSAESSRQLLSNYAARMLNQAGVAIPVNDNGDVVAKIEMSYLYALDVDDLMGKIDPEMKVDGDLLLE